MRRTVWRDVSLHVAFMALMALVFVPLPLSTSVAMPVVVGLAAALELAAVVSLVRTVRTQVRPLASFEWFDEPSSEPCPVCDEPLGARDRIRFEACGHLVHREEVLAAGKCTACGMLSETFTVELFAT